MKKTFLVIIGLLFLGAGSVSIAQNGGWDTSWIQSGSVINTELAVNLDTLEQTKVHKPGNCTGTTQRLVWNEASEEWKCETTGIGPATYADCSFNGAVVPHGASIPAYETSSVGYGESCNQEVRTCNDGVLSGSFTFGTCFVGSPDPCVFDGSTVDHGDSVTAYEESSVVEPESCVSEVRTCNDGNLSGTYTEGTCEVVACTDCGNDPIVAGCFIDTQAWDVPTESCFVSGVCTITHSITWSVGDFQRNTTYGVGNHEFRDVEQYAISWSGACTGTGTTCSIFDAPQGTYVATATVRDASTNQVVFTKNVTATKGNMTTCNSGSNVKIQ